MLTGANFDYSVVTVDSFEASFVIIGQIRKT